jgi:hypothetical protein
MSNADALSPSLFSLSMCEQVKKKKKLPLITLVRMARDAAFGILHLHKVFNRSPVCHCATRSLINNNSLLVIHRKRSSTATLQRATCWSARTTVP